MDVRVYNGRTWTLERRRRGSIDYDHMRPYLVRIGGTRLCSYAGSEEQARDWARKTIDKLEGQE